MAKNYKNILLALAGGLLPALAYPSWSVIGKLNLSFLVWVGFVPLFWVLFKKSRGDKPKLSEYWKIGFFAGLAYFALVFRWFWATYPLDTLGISHGVFSFLIVFLVYGASCLAMAVFWGLWTLGAGYFSGLSGGRSVWLVLPAVFVLTELLRALGFGLLWFGSGTVLGFHWTMGSPAYSLAANQFALGLSSFVGIYGLDFLIILANFFIYKIITAEKLSWYLKAVISGIFFICIAFFTPHLKIIPKIADGKVINFAVIQTDQPTKISYTSSEKVAFFKNQLTLLNDIAKDNPQAQLIVFPEASDFFKDLSAFLNTDQVKTYFGNLFDDPHLIISGARVTEKNNRIFSRVFSLDTKNDITGYYDKRLLTPLGEFLASPIKIISNIIAQNQMQTFRRMRGFSPGEKSELSLNFGGGFLAAPLVCSEMVSPALGRRAGRTSDIIVGMASNGIFHGSNATTQETMAIARLRAAENGKPMIVAANMGRSYALDSAGNIRFIAPDTTSQILTGDIIAGSGRTWYNKVGDWPILVVSGLVLGIIFIKTKKHEFTA